MASIFLSYAREDAIAAKSIADALENGGHSVWWDRHIKGGSEYAREIEAALNNADKIVVLWSHTSVGSAWVRDEAAIGRDSGRLIPSSIDGTPAPLGFRQYQTIDLKGWKDKKNDASVARLLDSLGDGAASTIEGPKQHSKPRKGALIAMGVIALLGTAAGALYLTGVLGPRQADAISMAVLPFDALPADDANTPFAEGVSEEILDQLARNPKLKLIGRTSAETFRGSNADARAIGGKLHVTYLLDGTVRRAGNAVKVGVALIRAKDGVELWRHTYSGELNDIFAIQQNIGQQVEGQLRAQFVGAKGMTASSLATSGEVYSYYLTARGLTRSHELAKINAAIGLLRRALTIDPNYAPAWAGLAIATRQRRFSEGSIVDASDEKERAMAISFADRALALAPKLAEAHIAKAIALEALVDTGDEGGPELQIAARLDPNNTETWGGLARYYQWGGQFPEEMEAWRRQVTIDPLSWPVFFHAAEVAWQLGYEAEARTYAREIERDDPQGFQAHMIRAEIAYRGGDLSGALQEGIAAKRMADAGTRTFADMEIAQALRAAGLLDRARPMWKFDVDKTIWTLWNGRALSSSAIAQLYRNTRIEWANQMVTFAVLKTLVASGRSTEAVALYRKRFSSPDAMLRYPSGHLGFIEDGTTIALALRDTGTVTEANQLLSLLRREAQKRLTRGPVPRNYRYYVAMIQAVSGDIEGAVKGLQQSTGRRWFYTQEKSLPDLAMEPAFRSLLKDPRFQRIVNQQRYWQAKERAEMASLLGQIESPQRAP